MSDTLAFAQYMTLRSTSQGSRYLFQNYWVNEDAPLNSAIFGFMPFAFSGTTVTKSGDNLPATIGFPNNELSRGWAEAAVVESWIATVSTVLVNPDDKSDATILSQYTGQIVSANWDETMLQLQMASVLDAVGTDVPRKRLTQQLVGNLPLTSNVRIG
jgi:hypothetical protein